MLNESMLHNVPFVKLLLAAAVLGGTLGCDNRPIGFLVQDGKAVYVTRLGGPGGTLLTREVPADPKTFQAVPLSPNARNGGFDYARDDRTVFMGSDSRPYALAKCDPATFAIITPEGTYARDAKRAYYRGALMNGADPETLQILQAPYSKDATRAFAGALGIGMSDVATFEVVMPGGSEFPIGDGKERPLNETKIWGWAKDKNAYYYGKERVAEADRQSFEVLADVPYAKDRAHVFHAVDNHAFIIPGADPDSFEIFGPTATRVRDKNYEYVRGKPIKLGSTPEERRQAFHPSAVPGSDR